MSTTSIFTTRVVTELLGSQFFFCLLPSKMGITDGIFFLSVLCSYSIPVDMHTYE